VFARRVASPDIAVTMHEPAGDAMLRCDTRMVGQALTNVLKNAAEAVQARIAQGSEAPGQIDVRIAETDGRLAVVVEDNGVGLPAKDRDRLTEPYVTTREKGTGLGLAIVKRIMEEHAGTLVMQDAPSGQGAQVVLQFSRLDQGDPKSTEPAVITQAQD
jgi:two-component system nitrogen regulation sensor histidine kinase NtrY